MHQLIFAFIDAEADAGKGSARRRSRARKEQLTLKTRAQTLGLQREGPVLLPSLSSVDLEHPSGCLYVCPRCHVPSRVTSPLLPGVAHRGSNGRFFWKTNFFATEAS